MKSTLLKVIFKVIAVQASAQRFKNKHGASGIARQIIAAQVPTSATHDNVNLTRDCKIMLTMNCEYSHQF